VSVCAPLCVVYVNEVLESSVCVAVFLKAKCMCLCCCLVLVCVYMQFNWDVNKLF